MWHLRALGKSKTIGGVAVIVVETLFLQFFHVRVLIRFQGNNWLMGRKRNVVSEESVYWD